MKRSMAYLVAAVMAFTCILSFAGAALADPEPTEVTVYGAITEILPNDTLSDQISGLVYVSSDGSLADPDYKSVAFPSALNASLSVSGSKAATNWNNPSQTAQEYGYAVTVVTRGNGTFDSCSDGQLSPGSGVWYYSCNNGGGSASFTSSLHVYTIVTTTVAPDKVTEPTAALKDTWVPPTGPKTVTAADLDLAVKVDGVLTPLTDVEYFIKDTVGPGVPTVLAHSSTYALGGGATDPLSITVNYGSQNQVSFVFAGQTFNLTVPIGTAGGDTTPPALNKDSLASLEVKYNYDGYEFTQTIPSGYYSTRTGSLIIDINAECLDVIYAEAGGEGDIDITFVISLTDQYMQAPLTFNYTLMSELPPPPVPPVLDPAPDTAAQPGGIFGTTVEAPQTGSYEIPVLAGAMLMLAGVAVLVIRRRIMKGN